MIEQFEQIEKNTKQIFKEMRQQLILLNSMDNPSIKALNKLSKLEGQLSTEIGRLNTAYFELAKVYHDMITSPNLKDRLEAVRLKQFFPSMTFNAEKNLVETKHLTKKATVIQRPNKKQ